MKTTFLFALPPPYLMASQPGSCIGIAPNAEACALILRVFFN